MPPPLIDYREHDRQIWEEEFEDFVPRHIFNAHIHMLNREAMPPDSPFNKRPDADLSTLREWMSTLYPGREAHFLVLGLPAPGIDVDAHNTFVDDQIARDPHSRANRLVTPVCKLERIEEDIRTRRFIGLKPYRFFSVTGDIAQCRIHEFLTHEQMELANDRGLWVTMHLSRYHGCADEHNLKDLEEYTTRRYPKIRGILAHCARSFTYWPIREAVDHLRDLPNIWYDLSAVQDPLPFVTLFQKEKIERLFYGDDGIGAMNFHGRLVSLGRAWQGLYADEAGLEFPHCDGRPILCVYEQLLAMKQAAEIAGLSRDDLEKIFWHNARRALGIEEETSAPRMTEAERG